jgi:transposase
MRPKGTPKELERIRLKAVAAVQRGERQVDVARIMGIYPDTLSKWVVRYRNAPDSLLAKPIPGRKPRLTSAQLAELVALLQQGAIAHGWGTDIWTCPRVAEVIYRHFGVMFHPDHVFKIVTSKLGWTFQRPEKVARERDPEKVAQWLSKELPDIKKKPRRKGQR